MFAWWSARPVEKADRAWHVSHGGGHARFPDRCSIGQVEPTFAGYPEKARAKQAPAIATLESGLKCRVVGPAGEEIKTDMPRVMGGNAADPDPGWFFRAALTSCCATVIAMRAARLGINLSKLEVAVESEGDNQGILGLDDRISAVMSGLYYRADSGG